MFVNEFFYYGFGFFYFVLWCGWVNDSGVQHFSSRVYDRNLAARAKSRVPAKNDLVYDGRLH